MINMPKVSIIVPVYNSEKYLRKCLDSLTCQTLKDIEILCVDGCSTDSSLQILQEYTQKDPRVKVIQESENRGLSTGRNTGIKNADGEYIQFVDSDDWIEPDTVELLYKTATNAQLDIVKFLIKNAGKETFDALTAGYVFPGMELLARIVCQPYCAIGVWSLFLNRKFMERNHLQFVPDMRAAEDSLFTFQAFMAAQRCMCINERKYVYVKREDSLSSRIMSDEAMYWVLYAIREILKTDAADCVMQDYQQTKFAYLDTYYTGIKRLTDSRLEIPNMSQWEPEIQKIYQIFFSGRGWPDNLIDREKLSLSKESIHNADRIYIFGAGNAAQRLIQILYQAKVEISGIIVSDTSKNRKTVYGYRVYSVDEVDPEGRPLILSAVKGEHDEIGILLREHGFNNIVCVCP